MDDTSFSSTPPAPELTGSYLVLLAGEQIDRGVVALRQSAGLSVESVAPHEVHAPAERAYGSGIVIPELGVAVVDAHPDSVRALGSEAADPNSPLVTVEPERVVRAIEAPPLTAERKVSEATFTWGLQLTGAAHSHFDGTGVAVAVLDTGVDDGHPDFAGRDITTESFTGEPPQDGVGHGTHCIGTACGTADPQQSPVYGIAHGASILAGKVLSNDGSGADRGILAGIAWAIRSGAKVASMSLGAAVKPGQPYSRVFEAAAKRAIAGGTLVIAAAGNESERDQDVVAPVGHPANCPSIMAVAALDSSLRVAWFSCGGTSAAGGQVDIAGPGVDVRSAWPRPQLYNTISGTSMATPHVSGIAALWSQAQPELDPHGLWSALVKNARRLPLSSADVGAGLVQAP